MTLEATTYCPTCEPTRDPVAEVLATMYCSAHPPAVTGADDPPSGISHLYGGTEAGGEENRRFCALLHRGRK